MIMTLKEAVELLEDGIGINLVQDDYEYEVAPAEDFVGGEGMKGYISTVLGNVVYSDAEGILEESIKFLKKEGGSVTIEQ